MLLLDIFNYFDTSIIANVIINIRKQRTVKISYIIFNNLLCARATNETLKEQLVSYWINFRNTHDKQNQRTRSTTTASTSWNIIFMAEIKNIPVEKYIVNEVKLSEDFQFHLHSLNILIII